jgi:lysozyme
MITSKAGIDLIKRYEDCKLVAYPDPKTGGAPWTVGWGATGPDIHEGTVWTQQQADDRLQADIAEREDMVNDAVTVPLTQGQFDAMVSIVFNVGQGSTRKDGIIRLKDGRPSTLLRLLNAGDYAGCADQFLRWVSPGSNVERGLRRRRTEEREMFLAGSP